MEHTIETYVYSHCNMCNILIYFCNIDIKHLQHTSETSEILETNACNMHFQHRCHLTVWMILATCRLAELDAGAEIDASAEWRGCRRWAGVVPATTDPHAGEGLGERSGGCRAHGAAPLCWRKAAEEGDWASLAGASVAGLVGACDGA